MGSWNDNHCMSVGDYKCGGFWPLLFVQVGNVDFRMAFSFWLALDMGWWHRMSLGSFHCVWSCLEIPHLSWERVLQMKLLYRSPEDRNSPEKWRRFYCYKIPNPALAMCALSITSNQDPHPVVGRLLQIVIFRWVLNFFWRSSKFKKGWSLSRFSRNLF